MLLTIASLGPIRFLGGTSNGLIALADAAANCFALAQYISGRHYQHIQMGPLHWWMLLLIASFWPNIFLWGTTNTLEWAHCIGGCCCQWLCFGSLFFWEVLLMRLDGPITLADAAANGFALAHYFFVVLLMLLVVPIALVNAAANGFTLIPKYGSQICFRYRWIAVKQNFPLDLLFSV